MEVLSGILKTVMGKVHFMIYMGKVPAAEIMVKDREITVKIVNPIAAAGVGLEEFLSRKGTQDIEIIRKIREAGYSIRITFAGLEVDL
jgi:hypothetical protein